MTITKLSLAVSICGLKKPLSSHQEYLTTCPHPPLCIHVGPTRLFTSIVSEPERERTDAGEPKGKLQLLELGDTNFFPALLSNLCHKLGERCMGKPRKFSHHLSLLFQSEDKRSPFFKTIPSALTGNSAVEVQITLPHFYNLLKENRLWKVALNSSAQSHSSQSVASHI